MNAQNQINATEKLWAVQGANGKLVTDITGEVELMTRNEADGLANGMRNAFGTNFTPIYMK